MAEGDAASEVSCDTLWSSPRVSSNDKSESSHDGAVDYSRGKPLAQSTATSSNDAMQAPEARTFVHWKREDNADAPVTQAFAIGEQFKLKTYPVKTRANKGCSLLIDTGSPTNLMSDSFHKELEEACKHYGIAEP